MEVHLYISAEAVTNASNHTVDMDSVSRGSIDIGSRVYGYPGEEDPGPVPTGAGDHVDHPWIPTVDTAVCILLRTAEAPVIGRNRCQRLGTAGVRCAGIRIGTECNGDGDVPVCIRQCWQGTDGSGLFDRYDEPDGIFPGNSAAGDGGGTSEFFQSVHFNIEEYVHCILGRRG